MAPHSMPAVVENGLRKRRIDTHAKRTTGTKATSNPYPTQPRAAGRMTVSTN